LIPIPINRRAARPAYLFDEGKIEQADERIKFARKAITWSSLTWRRQGEIMHPIIVNVEWIA
jgi:predicted Zn-dependent protease